MRTLCLALLVVAAGCDSVAGGDLDVGAFDGYDAQVRVVGSAVHRTDARTSRLESTLAPASDPDQRRTVLVDLPPTAAEAEGDFARVHAEASAAADAAVRESTADGAVTVTSVRASDGYATIAGTVALPFPSGTLTGTFRAVDARRPVPVRDCSGRDCVTY